MSQSNRTNQSIAMANMIGQIGCVTALAALVIIGLAFGAGRLLDNFFALNGVLTIIFMLGSFPVTLFVITRLSLQMVARMQKRTAALEKRETENLDEEEDKI